ncbi:CocE/NonD family hydrolase [Rhodococcus sp. IC4_135]|uniref:CocE/NonD family hydrolase n=1 Tax=Rhodococcus sp. IC4_135 TaxID=2715537 RepID=UPI00141E9D26|nr:CocE/NonD family hydrolase [Rhodococcus sp. IC4_135]
MAHVYNSGVEIPMRDGVTLAALVFQPLEGNAPTLLLRTPYGLASHGAGPTEVLPFVDAGYAVVWVESRGTFKSEGEFRPKTNEPEDGYDTVEWIISQPWSDGQVGTYGPSYCGMTQWATASTGHPALKASVVKETAMNWYRGLWYHPGGALSQSFSTFWPTAMNASNERRKLAAGRGSLDRVLDLGGGLLNGRGLSLNDHTPISTHPLLPLEQWMSEILDHPDYDEFWKEQDFTTSVPEMTQPVLSIAGWYDIFIVEQLRDFERFRREAGSEEARTGSRLVVGPWIHELDYSSEFPDRDFGAIGAAAACDLTGAHLQHFNRWLRPGVDAPAPSPAPVRLFVMGIDQWRDEQDWPLPDTTYVDYFLSGDAPNGRGELLLGGPGAASESRYRYDPRDPVPTAGGPSMPARFGFNGPVDQKEVASRPDVLCFTGPALDEDTEVTGYVKATLFVTSDAVDTDFTAKLVDVFPDGKAINLCDGILRARYRNGLDRPEHLVPGAVYEVEIDVAATSNVFRAGHRIRVDISSSNFPHYDRNTNTGGFVSRESIDDAVVAHNTILTGPDHPSRLVLPRINR